MYITITRCLRLESAQCGRTWWRAVVNIRWFTQSRSRRPDPIPSVHLLSDQNTESSKTKKNSQLPTKCRSPYNAQWDRQCASSLVDSIKVRLLNSLLVRSTEQRWPFFSCSFPSQFYLFFILINWPLIAPVFFILLSVSIYIDVWLVWFFQIQ